MKIQKTKVIQEAITETEEIEVVFPAFYKVEQSDNKQFYKLISPHLAIWIYLDNEKRYIKIHHTNITGSSIDSTWLVDEGVNKGISIPESEFNTAYESAMKQISEIHQNIKL